MDCLDVLLLSPVLSSIAYDYFFLRSLLAFVILAPLLSCCKNRRSSSPLPFHFLCQFSYTSALDFTEFLIWRSCTFATAIEVILLRAIYILLRYRLFRKETQISRNHFWCMLKFNKFSYFLSILYENCYNYTKINSPLYQ